MKIRFAFSQTVDGRLLITAEAVWGFPSGTNGKFCVAALEDENLFLQHVVFAHLSQPDTVNIIASVLLVVSGRPPAQPWLTVTIDALQLTALGLEFEPATPKDEPDASSLGFANAEDLYRVFMRAPIAICMLSGPDHIVTFINDKYVQMLGRESDVSLFHRPVREAVPEMEGQIFLPLLDRVFRTGEPYVGIETPAMLFDEHSHRIKEQFFDFIYHPVRDREGTICGILCQATDVTDRVLESHVREAREEQLYRQWAELEALYRDSPCGMCQIETEEYRIVRLNEKKAKLLGAPLDELVGRKIADIAPHMPDIENIYRQVAQSRSPELFDLSTDLPDAPGHTRSFLWSLNPIFNSCGEVSSIASIVIETTEWPHKLSGSLQDSPLLKA